MNEKSVTVRLLDLMGNPEGWGRGEGRQVFQKLLDAVESNPGAMVFRISMEGVRRTDISFASESVIEIARRFRGEKGFCLVGVTDPDILENWEAAAGKKGQPIMVWHSKQCHVLGPKPAQGCIDAFEYTLGRVQTKASEFASASKKAINSASNSLKQLWERGFLLRRQDVAESGGIEFNYFRIG